MAGNGSGWSENYSCVVHKTSINSFTKFIEETYPEYVQFLNCFESGFFLCLQTTLILNPRFVKNQSLIRKPDDVFILHLPPHSLSASLTDVNIVVDEIFAVSRVPPTDRDSLVRLLFSMGRRYEQTSTTTLVPLLFDFHLTYVFHELAEAIDWFCQGTMNSVIVRTLRATNGFILSLKEMSFDKSLSKMKNCTVCLEGFEGVKKVCRLSCSHEFHHTCIAKWLRCNNCCPLCRLSMPWIQTATSISDEVLTPSYEQLPEHDLPDGTLWHEISKKDLNLI